MWCLYTMDFVSAGKNTLLLYVTVCEKVVPQLNKHDDIIEWISWKLPPPPKWRAGCAPGVDCSPKDLIRNSFLGHSGYMAELTQLGSLDSEKWLDITGFTDFRPVLLVTKCHTVDSLQISHLCRLFFCQYSLVVT